MDLREGGVPVAYCLTFRAPVSSREAFMVQFDYAALPQSPGLQSGLQTIPKLPHYLGTSVTGGAVKYSFAGQQILGP